MIKKLIFALVATVIAAASAKAQSQVREGFAFHGGVFQHNIMTLTNNKEGKADLIGDTYLPIGFQYTMASLGGWHFSPSISFTHLTTAIVPKETPDEGAKKNLLFVHLPFIKNLTSGMNGKLGLGIFSYEIKGEGGTIVLNDGTGTSTFHLPSETKRAMSSYLLLGAAFPMNGWQMDVDLMVNGTEWNERRGYNLFLYITKHFGGI